MHEIEISKNCNLPGGFSFLPFFTKHSNECVFKMANSFAAHDIITQWSTRVHRRICGGYH